MLKLIRKTDQRSDETHFYWEAACETCGKVWTIRKGDLKRVKCCDAWGGTNKKPRTNYKNYKGQVVNDTVQVIEECGKTDDGLIVWSALCLLCQSPFTITSAGIRKGVFSCGCYSKKQTRLRALAKYKGESV